MDWYEKAEHLEQVSLLGSRESQIMILNNHGYTPSEISEMISEKEGTAPKNRTIESIITQLKSKYVQAEITQQAFSSRADTIFNPPAQSKMDFNESVTTHLYLGRVGCGKTVTAQTHALRLAENSDVEVIQVIDPLGTSGWESLSEKTDTIELISPSLDEDFEINLEQHKTSAPSVLFIDHLTPSNENYSNFSQDLEEVGENTSIRYIWQSIETAENFSVENISMIHLHRYRSDLQFGNWLDDSICEKLENLTPIISQLDRGTGGPASMISVDNFDSTVKFHRVVLSESEKKILEYE